MRYVEHDRSLKPSTLRCDRSIVDAYLLPAFGSKRVEAITTRDVERWHAQLTGVGGGGKARGRRVLASQTSRSLPERESCGRSRAPTEDTLAANIIRLASRQPGDIPLRVVVRQT
jgi:hypothetical protein